MKLEDGYTNKTDVFYVPSDFRSIADSDNVLLCIPVLGQYRIERKIV